MTASDTADTGADADRGPDAGWRANLTTGEQGRVDLQLDQEQVELLNLLHDSPEGTIGALREDLDLAVAITRADVVPRLLSWFTPLPDPPGRADDGWSHEPERSGPVGESSVCVTWSFAGTYDADGPADRSFNGLTALGQEISLHGVTFMGVEPLPGDPQEVPRFLLRRYIDWAGLYAQLGLTLNWRVPHEAGSRRARAEANP